MRDTILCLCDLTGVMARPWVEHGYQAVLVDPQHGCDHEDGAYLKLACTIEEAFDQISVLVRSGRLAFVAGFPPCTDMAVSGAQWFARKYEADHMFQAKAVSVAEQCRVIGEMSGVPYMVEGYAEGTLDFTPACSFQLLESQLYAMGTYANILQERARIEQVDLNAPLEGGESGEVPQD